jgi:hypothetical protein
MNLISRRRTMGKKEDTYIQDGLVFWLDGIDKGNDPTAWTDLVNGIAFPYNNGQEIRSDSVYFNGNAGLTSSSLSFNHPLESCQIEVVVDNNYGIVILPYKSDNIAFGFYRTDIIIGSTSYPIKTTYRKSNFPQKKTSYSMNVNYLYYDDVVLNSIVNDFWAIRNANIYEIGHRDNNVKYIGNIYSIRIYNRHLSDEERVHNNNIDKQRFGL